MRNVGLPIIYLKNKEHFRVFRNSLWCQSQCQFNYVYISVIHTAVCITVRPHGWFGMWFRATDHICRWTSRKNYLMVRRTSVGWKIHLLKWLVKCGFISSEMFLKGRSISETTLKASYLVQFTQGWWILSLYIPGGHGSHLPKFIPERLCSQMHIS